MNKLGGLSRRYTKIEELRNSNETLLVDSGNSLFSSDELSAFSPVKISKAKGIARIYAAMEYDAINIGTYDLVAGIPFLQELSFLPWISANFYDVTGKPLFKPFVIKSKNDLKIGVIGLSADIDLYASDIRYQPWQEVLPPLIDELDKKTDFIIVLSSLAMAENENIALNFPSIRIIFSASPGNRSFQIREENKAILAQTMDRGRYLGYLFLQNPQLSKWQERSTITNEEKVQRTLQYRLQRIDTMLQRQDNISEAQKKQLLNEKEKLNRQLKDSQRQNEQVAASYFYRNIPILQNIKQNDEIELLLQSIENEMKNVKANN